MLYNVKVKYSDGTVKEELISSQTPPALYPKRDNVIHSMANIHKYEYEHIYPPTLFIDSKGQKLIMPTGIEVHPDTTVDDINWTKPKLKKVIEHIEGSMGKYKTTYDPNKKTYKCSCMGYFRAKDRRCKHIKVLEEKNLATVNS